MDKYEFTLIHNRKAIKFSGDTVKHISSRVQQFYANNKEDFDVKKLEAQIENQLKTAPIRSAKKRIPRLSEAYHASLALFRFADGKTVDQKELDRRQSICLDCPLRAKTSFCAGCGGLSRATQMLNDARRLTRNSLRFNDKLKTEFCGACGCSLPLLLATQKEYLPDDSPVESAMRPDNCWVKK